MQEFVSFTTDAPESFNSIGPSTLDYGGGDFMPGDLSTLYMLDAVDNVLIAKDVATADETIVGTVTPQGGGFTWSGMAGDPTSGTMYAIATDCANAALYTIDVEAATAELVGPVSTGGCLINLAVNADGEMYSADIISDALFQIDPDTGDGTFVGPLGIDLNFAQSADFDDSTGVLYFAAYTALGGLAQVDTTTGAATLLGDFPEGAEVDAFAIAVGLSCQEPSDVPWLSVAPTAGETEPGGSDEVVVTLDATGLMPGLTYQAALCVNSNDYDNPTVVVPVTLTTPGVNIVVEPDSLDAVQPSEAVTTQELLIGNTGTTPSSGRLMKT